jgi:hypothetical protein
MAPSTRVKLSTKSLEKMRPGEVLRDSVVGGLVAECGRKGGVSLKIQAELRRGPRTGVARPREKVSVTFGDIPGDLLGGCPNRSHATALGDPSRS